MELTPQQFIEAEFSEVRRGFDRDEVDAFLVKAAKGVEAMQKHITDLEGQLAQQPPESPSDETIGRTLKLAAVPTTTLWSAGWVMTVGTLPSETAKLAALFEGLGELGSGLTGTAV
jgi:DivIVA domain-containing protein